MVFVVVVGWNSTGFFWYFCVRRCVKLNEWTNECEKVWIDLNWPTFFFFWFLSFGINAITYVFECCCTEYSHEIEKINEKINTNCLFLEMYECEHRFYFLMRGNKRETNVKIGQTIAIVWWVEENTAFS